MRQFILLAFISAFLTWNIATSKVHRFPSHRARLAIGSKNEEDNENKEEKRIVCKTQECNSTAEYLLNSMNKSVDPCTDFYEYACGNWPKHFPIDERFNLWNPLYVIQTKIQKEIKEMLKTGPEKSDLFAVKLAKTWYQTCEDTDAMDKQGFAPLIATLSRIGGWPMIMEPDEWNEQEYNWQKVDDHYMRLTGRNSLHDLRVEMISEEDILKARPEVHVTPPSLPPGVYEMVSQTRTDEDEQSDEQGNGQKLGSEPDDDNDDMTDDSSDDCDDDDEDSDDDWDVIVISDDSNDDCDDDDDDDDSNDDCDDCDDDDDDDDSNDDCDDCDDDDDDDDYDDDDTDSNEIDAKKVGKKLSTDKKTRSQKNKKLRQNKKKKNNIHISKKNNYKIKGRRTKRGTISTRNNNKRAQHFAHRRIHNRKIKQNERRDERKRTKIVLNKKRTSSRASQKNTNKIRSKQMQVYSSYILKVARALAKEANVKVSRERLDNDIQNVVEFQFKLIDLAMKSSENVNMTLDDFQEWYDEKNSKTANSEIDWTYKVATTFYEAGVLVDEDLHVVVTSPDYFEALASLLDETPSRTIVNYIHWNFVSRMLHTTTSEMRDLYKAWIINNNAFSLSECDKEMNMTAIVGYEYVRRYFSDKVMQTAKDMFDDIQKEIEYRIKEAEWMDDDTKDSVLSKLVHIEATIGYPKWFKNDTFVKYYFRGLILSDSYYENTLSFDRYFRWAMLRRVQTTVVQLDKETEINKEIPTSEVGGNYVPQINYLVIPSADFRSPLFDLNRPPAINYGFIGWIMAHEVNHGFDNSGHRFDKTGKNIEWLSTMAEAYGKRTECFVEQFNNYPVDKMNTTIPNYGNQTINDNIADTMGLQAAYKAYQRRERECEGSNLVLPGLEELTNDQLFFLSSANLWCESVNPIVNEVMLASGDEHSRNRLRIIGSLSNSEDFARAYNCPIGSPMNPKKKCNIWK
ncbi:neprilysin-like isoform X2 [Pseudomyrmex gracilis]|uniref:neprilysin-like isoform X2 n=1 Tax=Pseudomyrmex gracilis TaxID=219809 RepID=UPI0009949EAA|nr:neprilysin-like isoform X2 [Pseudomyrmex gracilis]